MSRRTCVLFGGAEMNSLDFAKWFILNNDEMHERRDLDTHMKLQKLLYFSQAMHLAVNNKRSLFTDRIEAWFHGPVVTNVFRAYEYDGLIDEALSLKDNPFAFTEISDDSSTILNVVNFVYGYKTGSELSEITHREAPWENLKQEVYLRKNPIITTDSMYTFYRDSLSTIFEAYKDYDFNAYEVDSINGNHFRYYKGFTIPPDVKEQLWIHGDNCKNQSYFIYLDERGELVIY